MTVIKRDSPGELMLTPHDVITADAAPALLTQNARGGSVVVRYSRIERWDVSDKRAVSIWRRPAWAGLALAAGGGAVIGAALTLAFAGQGPAPVKARDASVSLRPAIAETPPPVVRPAAAPAPVRKRQAVSAAAPVAVALPSIEPDSEAAALAKAFSTNEPASWAGTGGSGTVVVGPAAIERGRYCRDVAILTRADGAPDRTVNTRKCLSDGRIAEEPAPVPE